MRTAAEHMLRVLFWSGEAKFLLDLEFRYVPVESHVVFIEMCSNRGV